MPVRATRLRSNPQKQRTWSASVVAWWTTFDRRSYHYVIDRFGRVWRTVPEGSIAFHAGFSVWGDRSALFVNLNSSFLGVALESGAVPSRRTRRDTPHGY